MRCRARSYTQAAAFLCLVWCVTARATGAVVGPPKRAYEDLPGDQRRARVEEIRQSPHAYEIQFRGTVDGTMTRGPIGYAAYRQGWQPNRSVLIENVGEADVASPWILVNGKRKWRSLAEVVAEATRGYTSPADKARILWERHRRRRFHACTWDAECSDLIKVLNVYGYTLCGNEAQIVNDLWKAAGLTTRRGHPIGHSVTEVRYGGAWHLLDSDEHVICLQRDNRTIAACADIVRDHDLVKRTHTYGILRHEGRRTDEFSASLYSYEGKRQGGWGTRARHTMSLTLRPGESLELRWDHVGKQYTAGKALKKGQRKVDGLGDLLAGWGRTAYDHLRNGKLRYRPDLSRPTARRGVEAAANARFDAASASIRPADGGKPATVTWRFASPYVFVGGKARAAVRLGAKASAEWRYSPDRKAWQTIASLNKPGAHPLVAALDDIVSPRGKPTYGFWLQLALRGDAAANDSAFEHDIQTSLLGLPELEVGTNRIVYSDASQGERRIRITHRWLERTAWHPPHAPAEALAPKDGAVVRGSRVAFRWSPAPDPDGDPIRDYHFELSEHADLRWPLSPNFEKLTSHTPSKGKPEWTIPAAGLLNPNTTYYWRVRAQDAAGVWGPWSRTFRFRIQAPGVPLGLKLVPRGKTGFVLHWRPNPQGEPPVAYKVYGSDERGFTASDTEHLVFRGKGFVKSMEEFEKKPAKAPDAGRVKTPANLIARVTATSLQVVGPGLTQANTNRAFYRVVAVDAAGTESCPSDYAAVPRPFVSPAPSLTARVGQPYRYQPRAIRSTGDLRCRRSKRSSYNAAFWDREVHAFTAIRLPAGLALDPQTGLIAGRPTKPGVADVAFKVADQFGKSQTLSHKLTVSE